MYRMYERGVTNFNDMTDLSKVLRSKLSESATIGDISIDHELQSRDGTIKRLYRYATIHVIRHQSF